MSLNSLLDYRVFKKHAIPVIVPCNPNNIYFDDPSKEEPYVLNYVLKSKNFDVIPYTKRFSSYRRAFKAMNQIRIKQGFKTLPQPQPYRG
tara:strand:+ start:1149 stop:1418 length:270 start_codon:yes stop_codon:yes gene_type:complete